MQRIQSKVFLKFATESPLTVMVRVMLENIFPADQFDQLFPDEAEKLFLKESLFSAIVDLLSSVGQIQSKIHSTFQNPHNELKTALNSFYRKILRIKPSDSTEWVRKTAERLDPVIRKMGRVLPYSLSGYSVRSVTGIDFSAANKHPKTSRYSKCKNLPSQNTVLLDPNLMLVVDMVLHGKDVAQGDDLLRALLKMVQLQEVWVTNHIFDNMSFEFGIEKQLAFFLMRQNQSNLLWMPAGRRRLQGQIDLGTVFEQKIHIINSDGNRLPARRITIELENRTPDGQLDLHILTNLPKRFQCLKLSEFCHRQWTMECAFQELAVVLQNEVETAGYPGAYFFVYCLALVAYNILSAITSVLGAIQKKTNDIDDVSWFYLANEIGSAWRGMMIAIPSQNWSDTYANLTTRQLANTLLALAKNVCLPQSHKLLPKQKPQKHGVKGMHIHLFSPSNARN